MGWDPTLPPMGWDPTSPPMGWDPTLPPMGWDPTLPPMGWDLTSPPMGWDPTSPPMGWDPTSPPMGWDPTLPPMGWDPPLPLDHLSQPLPSQSKTDWGLTSGAKPMGYPSLHLYRAFCVHLTVKFSQSNYLAKSQCSARTLVFGTPQLNNTDPNNPGRNEGLWHKLGASTMKCASWPLAGQSSGQKGADGQQGTISVPFAAQTMACLITLGTSAIGGHHQFDLPCPVHRKSINCLRTRVPGVAIETRQQTVVYASKSVNGIGAPCCIQPENTARFSCQSSRSTMWLR